jgi:hypothetical protein
MSNIAERLREQVRARAGRRCEYCLQPEDLAFARHQIDHVIAEKHGGETVLDNLALCCGLCNRRKEATYRHSIRSHTSCTRYFIRAASVGPITSNCAMVKSSRLPAPAV